MANIKSQIKRNRQNERRRLRNKGIRSQVRTVEKSARLDEGSDATASSREAARLLDRAVAKGVVHKRTAARRKSRLARRATPAQPAE